MSLTDTRLALATIWPSFDWTIEDAMLSVCIEPIYLRGIVKYLHEKCWRLGTIVAVDRDDVLQARYLFYATAHPGWMEIVTNVDPVERTLPSITPIAIAADWFEREIEDVFSIRFSSHPRLGDFVLHEGPLQPHRVLEEEGAFVMPVGPIFSGETESALFLLETAGEDVVRAMPRLFYKYRAIEKLAEGKTAADVLLLAERCNGTSAIGNAWAYCRAVERACGIKIPARAEHLRTFVAELERVRHHMTALREICNSTALTVAASQALWIEERMLRACGELGGHRYLFGVLALGGMARDFEPPALEHAVARVTTLVRAAGSLVGALGDTSSFLDRIEGVGIITERDAHTFELLGPLARASGVAVDMRTTQSYGNYASLAFDVPVEREGDGYARLRVLFSEMEQSLRILRALLSALPNDSIRAEFSMREGQGCGWTEAPRGASVHWVEVRENGTLARYRLTPPSFRNWHGFHIATEGFAFQDFPIILATLDLSVAENDR